MTGVALILQNNPSVTEINCGSGALSGSVNLSTRNLLNLSGFICNNQELSSFSVANNHPALENLELSGNNLLTLPDVSLMDNLVNLYVDDNPALVDYFPNKLNNSLIEFSASNCALTGDLGALTVTDRNKLINIKSLNLSNNNLSAGTLADFVVYLTSSESINLSNNSISGPLPRLTFSSNNLRTFDVQNNQLSGLVFGWGLSTGPDNALFDKIYVNNNNLSTGSRLEILGKFYQAYSAIAGSATNGVINMSGNPGAINQNSIVPFSNGQTVTQVTGALDAKGFTSIFI